MPSSGRERVAVVGASTDPERYSNKALRMLREYGHEVVPVAPELDEVEGLPVVHGLDEIKGGVDTVTLYVSPRVSSAIADEILALRPLRVIFNPGAENPPLRDRLEKAGIRTVESCTLVLLRTGQF